MHIFVSNQNIFFQNCQQLNKIKIENYHSLNFAYKSFNWLVKVVHQYNDVMSINAKCTTIDHKVQFQAISNIKLKPIINGQSLKYHSTRQMLPSRLHLK